MTAWLTGMLAIASVLMCAGLWPLVKVELRSGAMPWYRNRALMFSGALFIHGFGAILLFASPLAAIFNLAPRWQLYLIYATFGIWLLAKAIIISAVSNRIKLCLFLFAAWTAACSLWAVFGK